MGIFYDAARHGFYDPAIAPAPAGAVEITAEAHASLLAAQASGMRIVADADGRPRAVAPPPPSLATLKAEAVAELARISAQMAAPFTAGIDVAEMAAWPIKEAAARAVIAGAADAAQTAMVADEAALTGETAAALAALIVERADAMRSAVARLSGERRRVSALIAAAADATEVEAAMTEAGLARDAFLAALTAGA